MTASARPVSMMIRGFQPRFLASPAAMCRVWSRAGPVMADATQWALSKCRDSPGAGSSSCVWPGGAAGRETRVRGLRLRAGAAGAAHPGEWQLLAATGPEVRRDEPAPACGGDPGLSQHSRQCPFLTAMIRRQPAHSPAW